MQIKRFVLLIVVFIFGYSFSPSYAGDIISCDSFENCPDGSVPLTNALLALEARMDALEEEINEPGEDWVSPDLQSEWQAYGDTGFFGTPGFYKDKQGVVHLRGVASGGSCGQPVFTLPSNYRPPYVVLTNVYGFGGATRVDVGPDGTVRVLSNCSNTWVSLWDISFRTY